jgi:ankyrin repeat protein
LRRTLSSLPRSLDETYRRILESIEKEEQAHVRRILQWLCFSKRPLRLEEIAVIYHVADRIQPPFPHEDELFHPEDIIGICRGLLSLSSRYAHSFDQNFPTHNLRIIQLAHFSVMEYLISSFSSPWTIDEDLSHVTILKSAIACYLHSVTPYDIQSPPGPKLTLKDSLAEYSVQYIAAHLTPVGEHSDLLPSLRLLLHPPSTPIATKFAQPLLAACKSSQNWWEWHEPVIASDPATNLYLAIRLGLPQVCQSLLATNVQLDLAGPLYSCRALGCPPLVEAVRYGERKIVQVLLDARAKYHYCGSDPLMDGSAVEEAFKTFDAQVVRMLFNAAAGMPVIVSRFGRSLRDASTTGHEELVRVFTEAGVDMNLKCHGETALEGASRSGHAKIVTMLLDAGAAVDAGDSWALHYASAGGYEEVTRILIEAGAAVNLKLFGETALDRASRFGHTKIVKMLLDAGAQVDAGDSCALYYASEGGYGDVVRVLIEAGAPMNLKFFGETALDRAWYVGHRNIVQMFLDAGATFENVGRIQNHSYLSCVVDDDEDNEESYDNDPDNWEAIELEGELEEDDESRKRQWWKRTMRGMTQGWKRSWKRTNGGRKARGGT